MLFIGREETFRYMIAQLSVDVLQRVGYVICLHCFAAVCHDARFYRGVISGTVFCRYQNEQVDRNIFWLIPGTYDALGAYKGLKK